MTLALTAIDRRLGLGILLAAAAGIGIALMDSSPSWDDTGVTVFALLLAAAGCGALAGRRPWLIALLVGGFTPLIEIVGQGHGGAALVTLLFAGVGAFVGSMLGRVFEQNH
ncbi:MAG TPA: hypothetical protein VF484_10715 [Candidatus Limnocylindrales bacterium]